METFEVPPGSIEKGHPTARAELPGRSTTLLEDVFSDATGFDWAVRGEEWVNETVVIPAEAILKDLEIEDGAQVADVTISCNPERLDDASGSYEFSDIKISSPSVNTASDLDVQLQYQWRGNGLPTGQNCEITVLDDAGTVLCESTRGFPRSARDLRTRCSQ